LTTLAHPITGLAIHAGTHRQGMEQPAHVWVPSVGISGLMIYTGNRFPEWRGNLLWAAWRASGLRG
jgi:glucose/arabinose dehydrogenase